MFQRDGIRLADLTAPQRTAVDTLLSAALSRDGYRKVREIMLADGVLGKGQGAGRASGAGGRGGGGGPRFAEDEYFLAFLGTPSATAPWMLQFGGHHLAINLTMAGSQASMAPSLPAAQPATYTFEGRTVRPLGNENDKAFALINALNDDQRKQAILGSRVADLVLGPGQDGRTIQPEGIRASALTAPQQTMLLDLVREWTGIMNDVFAESRMAEIRTNLPDTYFAWSGPTTNRQRRLLPHPGPNARDRIRAARQRRPHPHYLSRSDQRLRCEVHAEVGVPPGAGADDDHHRRRQVSAHRRDEYLQAARSPSLPIVFRSNWTLRRASHWPTRSSRTSTPITMACCPQTSNAPMGGWCCVRWISRSTTPPADAAGHVTFPDVEAMRRGEGTIRLESTRASRVGRWALIGCRSGTDTTRIAVSIWPMRWCPSATRWPSPRSGATTTSAN